MCPILDTSDDPVLFNNQFYDRRAFDTSRAGKDTRNAWRLESGYINDRRVFLRTQERALISSQVMQCESSSVVDPRGSI